MAGRQVHVPEIADVPCTDDDTARIGIVFDGIHSLLYLVYDTRKYVPGRRSRPPIRSKSLRRVPANISRWYRLAGTRAVRR